MTSNIFSTVPFPVVNAFKTAGTYKKGVCVACATINSYYLHTNIYTYVYIFIPPYVTLNARDWSKSVDYIEA